MQTHESFRRPSCRRVLAATLPALLACGLLISAACRCQESAAVPHILPYPTETRSLANGLKVIVMPIPSDGLVAYWTIVRTGSRDEYEAGHTGFAHFFEHMMFRGTERYPAAEYNRIVTSIGADTNAYTTDDYTAYHFNLAAEDLETVMQLESDRFQNLKYSESAFQTEAGAVYGEYRKDRTDPDFALYEQLVGTAFTKHTYGHTTMGFERDIAAMPKMYDYSRTFFARYYRPENTVLFIAGAVTPAAVFPLVEKYYGEWQRGYMAPKIPVEPEQTSERHVDVQYDGQTLPLLEVAYKLPVYDPADRTRVAADLFSDLAFGETSAAYRKLVLEEQVVEELDAGASHNRDPQLLEIRARVKDPGKVDYVLGVIDATVAEFRSAPPDPARVTALQRRLKYGFLMGLQTPDSVAARVAQPIAVAGDLSGLDELYATYAAITPADVQAAVQRYLQPERRTVGILRPKP
jgi:zinc protease